MAKSTKLARPPITEALIDVGTSGTGVPGKIPELRAALSGYPEMKVLRGFQTDLRLEEDAPPAAETRDIGIRGVVFANRESGSIVQCKEDGFTFNRLAPYPGWESFSDEARGAWRIFRSCVAPLSPKRLAVRFINRIELEMHTRQFEEYLLAPPQIPSGLPNSVSEFLSRLVVPVDSGRCLVAVTQFLERVPNPRNVAYVLDVECSTLEFYDPSSDWFERELGELRALKNGAFFGSLTESALSPFQ